MQRSERRQISDQANNCFFKSIAFLFRCNLHPSPFLLSPNGPPHPFLNKRSFPFFFTRQVTNTILQVTRASATFLILAISVSPQYGSKEVSLIIVSLCDPLHLFSVVRTKLDADQKLLHAKSLTISIRCYESRIGRVNTLQSKVLVDYTQVLWSKPAGVDFEQVGNLEYPFRFTVPAKVAGFSTAVFVDYRCIWRVEAGMCLSASLRRALTEFPSSLDSYSYIRRWLASDQAF